MGRLHKLTARTVGNAPPGLHGDGGNLFLNVGAGGAKSWIFRFTSPKTGKRRDLGLGSALTVTLAEAREKATALRKDIADGNDPLEVREAPIPNTTVPNTGEPTLEEVFKEFYASRAPSWRSGKHAAQWGTTLETYAPGLMSKPVSQIAVQDVADALRPIWKTKCETASRVRQRIEKLLKFAEAKDLPARPTVAAVGRITMILGDQPGGVRHHPAAPLAEAPALFRRILEPARMRPVSGAAALAVMVLTAARSAEIRQLQRHEVDLENAMISLPDDKMKAARPHRKPLSPAAVELIRAAMRVPDLGGGYVFQTSKGKPLSDMAPLMQMRRMGVRYVPHGWRSTFRDWASELTEYPKELAEEQLAHQWADATEAAYARGDMLERRRALMADWEKFLLGNGGK